MNIKKSFFLKSYFFAFIAPLFGLIISYYFLTKSFSNNHDFQKINSFIQATDSFEDADANTLVLFDVDDVLISAYDPLARDSNYPFFFKLMAIIKHPRLLYDTAYVHDLWSIMFDQSKRFIIEPEIIHIIKSLQQRDVEVLGLTSMETGFFGVIQSMPEWRFAMLNNLGVTFTQTYSETYFTTLPAYRNNYPGIYKGIMCCNQQPKGKVLEAFLNKFDVQPKSIIFFDDGQSNLQSVADACKKRNIPYKGYQYLVKPARLPGSWNTWRALKQLDYLIKHKQWLSDKEYDLKENYDNYYLLNR